MALALIAPDRNLQPLRKELLAKDSTLEVAIWPEVEKPERIQFAVCWHQPTHAVENFPNLKAISSLGAGVDHILEDDTIPASIPVCRVISENLCHQMKEYIFQAVLNYQRSSYAYVSLQKQAVWNPLDIIPADDLAVGVMGLGALGKPIAADLAAFGYPVYGWSNSEKRIEGVETFSGREGLFSFISKVKVLVCLLPLTNQTRDILSLKLFQNMDHPGYLINAARGEHLVDEDLIYALEKEWLAGACLDVFREEPLPENHPFWNRTNITITPHVASITDPQEAANQIIENYKRACSGMPLKNEIDRERGY